MKLVFASDSFKGSLSSKRTGELLQIAAEEVFGNCETRIVPIADGGEGTLDAVLSAGNGRKETVVVHDPLFREHMASYGILSDGSALIEMAEASGLTLLTEEERNPLYTSSVGTGELIKSALEKGCRRITVAIGGSATNDGGMGCMKALGVRFLDREGEELAVTGKMLRNVDRIDASDLFDGAKAAGFTVMCDVTNPLCQKNGATYTFGPQKGATPEMLCELEYGMENYRRRILDTFGIDCDCIPGAGAAGGLGAALKVFLQAEMKSGIRCLLDLVHFDEIIKGADLIVTGEGRADEQSCHGKVMQGIGLAALKAQIPVYALCGSVGKGSEELLKCGIMRLYETKPENMSVQEAMERAEELYLSAAVRMFRELKGFYEE